MLDKIGLHPSYASTYTVNRSSRSWDQSLGINRRFGNFEFSNNWSLNNRRDTSQNDLRGRRGLMDMKLDYGMKGLGALKVGLDGRFNRHSQLSRYQDQVNNRTDLGLAVTSKLPEQLMHRLIAPLSGFTLATNAGFGYDGERNANRRTAFRDSVKVDGSFRRYDMTLAGNVGAFRTNTVMRRESRSGDSRTRQYDVTSGQRLFELNDSSDDVLQRWDTTIDWSPRPTITGNLVGRWVHDFTQYWDTQAFNNSGAMEEKDGRDTNGKMLLSWKPNTVSEFRGEVERGEVSGDYGVQLKDFRKRTTRGLIFGKWQVPEFVQFLGGTGLEATLSSDEARNTLQETVGFRQVNRKLRTLIRRNLGTKIQIQGIEEITLLQYFYDDRANDRDEKRSQTDAVITYRPSGFWNGLFNVNYGQRQSVNISGLQAGQNNTTETYRISGEVGYTKGMVKLTQRYTIQADYTYFDFDEANNSLVRTNGVVTTFAGGLGQRLAVQMIHEYQFRDSGKYIRAQTGGARYYQASTRETRHAMTLACSYPLAEALRLEARQKFERRQNKSLATNRVSATPRGEFSLRADMKHDFSENFRVSGSFAKTESMTERDYWTITASVSRVF